MREKEFIDNIIDRCVHLTGGSNLNLILQLMDILLLIKKAVKDYEAKITSLEKQPLMDLLPKAQYVEYLEKIRNCMDGFKVTFVPNAGSGNYNSHIVDFLFPGEMIDSNRENAEKIRLVINTLESDDFSFTGFWTNGITNGLKALADCLEKISSLVEKQWTKQQYEFMAEEMVEKYTHVLSKTGKKAFDHYTSWKKRCLGDKGEYQGLLSVQLKNLLDTGFIIVDEEHLPNLYKKHKQVLAIYMDDDECSDVYHKKFYFLSKFLDHKNGCFLLGDKAALGKYLFLNRGELDIKDIEAFFFFVNICFWVNKDLTEMADNGQKDGKGTDAEKQNGNETSGSRSLDSMIPADCKTAVEKFILPTFTLADSIVRNSSTQIIKASRTIELTSNVQVAMLMAIGKEVNAVKTGCKCPDFVRALIGLGVIAYSDIATIKRMANGMNKKIKSYSDKGQTRVRIPSIHQWSIRDREIGKKIYDAMITVGE